VHNESIKGFGRAKDGHVQQADPHVSGTSSRVLGSMLGMAQKPFEQRKREEKYMALAHKRFVESKHDEQQRTADEHLFALAMLQLGASIRFEDMQHIQPSLTDCVVRDAREIPCVTCEHGFLFVLSFVKGIMHVRPVTPTLCWDTADDAVNAKSFTTLPAEPSSLPACDFAKFFRQGLAVQPSTAADEPLRVSIDTGFSEHKRLPSTCFL